MLKNIFHLLSSLCLVFMLGACTSTETANEEADAAAIGDESLETAEGEDAFGMDESLDGDATFDETASNELAPDEQLPEDTGGDAFATDDLGADPFAEPATGEGGEAVADADPFAESAGGEADPFAEPAADAPADGAVADAGGEADPFAEPATDSALGATDDVPPPTEMADSSGMPDSPAIDEPAGPPIEYGAGAFADSSEEVPVKRNIPVTKVADTPYQQAGVLVNAVYITRPGDTLASISQKIYGSDRADDLRKVNPAFRNKEPKTGAKIYYNSPNRPDDNTKLLTFYEDMGLSPEIYVSKDGDNIREISKNLLGDSNSWKEVWATNPDVESKGELEAGQQLRYWAATDVGQMAAAPPAPAPDMNDMGAPPPNPEMAGNDIQSPPPLPEDASMPPPPDMAQNDMGVPPPSAGTMEPPPPPPPPSEAMMEPPPPPPSPAGSPNRMAAKADGAGDDETLILGIGAFCLLAAVGMFIVLRKKRARRQLDFNTSTQTQIEQLKS